MYIFIILFLILLINYIYKIYDIKCKYVLILILILIIIKKINVIELFNNEDLLAVENRKFPYRYFKDENNNILPIVALTAFFRSDDDKNLYYKYINAGIKVIGITAYKTFPIKIRDDSEDPYHLTDNFDYVNNIKIWLTCMNDCDIKLYNFNSNNILLNMSESDFYNAEDMNMYKYDKNYDYIYICNKDSDNPKCVLDGWNAINRNYNLALKCFPIMANEYNLKGLCVGRIGCDLSKYNITVTDFLPYHELQQKMRESKFLFLPNIYDASPRVIAECLIKDLPVLMNKSIVCGTKYINNQTGELFIDEHNIRNALDNILKFKSPRKWWIENHNVEFNSIKLRDFLYTQYPELLEKIKNVSFII